MDKRKDKQLGTVLEVAGLRRDDALRLLGQARHALAQGEQQLQQLDSYAAESQARWNARASQGVTPQLLHHHRQFMARLDEASQFQRDVIQRLQADVRRCEDQLVLAEREMAALNKYVDRQRQNALRTLERQDQKFNDEMAANAHRRQLANPQGRYGEP